MKKTILNFIAIFGLVFSSNAQDNIVINVKKAGNTYPFPVTNDNTDYSSGHSPFVYNTTTSNEIYFEMDVINNSGIPKSWRISRINQVETPLDWPTHIAVGSTCFPYSLLTPYITPGSNFTATPAIIRTLELGNGETGYLEFSVIPVSTGIGNFMFYLTDNENTYHEDSIHIQINYSSLGLNENSNTTSFSIFPNPTNNQFSILLNNNEKRNIKIVDILGDLIYEEEIISSSDINVSEFKNGVYFVSIETNGIQSQVEKLVIKH